MSNNTQPFEPAQFTPTQFDSAEVKASFGNDLVKFIRNGFKWADFTDFVYKKLSNCFMHIAHYDRRGFFHTWFDDPTKIREWLDYVASATPVGSAAHTYSDFERAFQVWIRENRAEIQSVIEGNADEKQALADDEGEKVEFVVVAISSNTGDFGHKQHILVGRNGVGFFGYRQPSAHVPGNEDLEQGRVFEWTVDANGMPVERTEWFETSNPMPDRAPDAVIEEAFANAV